MKCYLKPVLMQKIFGNQWQIFLMSLPLEIYSCQLLEKSQSQIDAWHKDVINQSVDYARNQEIVKDIGCIVEEKDDFLIAINYVDDGLSDLLTIPLLEQSSELSK